MLLKIFPMKLMVMGSQGVVRLRSFKNRAEKIGQKVVSIDSEVEYRHETRTSPFRSLPDVLGSVRRLTSIQLIWTMLEVFA